MAGTSVRVELAVTEASLPDGVTADYVRAVRPSALVRGWARALEAGSKAARPAEAFTMTLKAGATLLAQKTVPETDGGDGEITSAI